MVISVDAQILIWGVQGQATAQRQEMIPRARAFFERCKAEQLKIHLPAFALAEYIVGLDQKQQAESLAALSRTCLIAPFDGKAAIIAASLQREWRQTIKPIQDEYSLTRGNIKADICVLACAIASGATVLYSEDPQMSRLAKGMILVKPLPGTEDKEPLARDASDELDS
jgi:predicted nucleic acid-binding protein